MLKCKVDNFIKLFVFANLYLNCKLCFVILQFNIALLRSYGIHFICAGHKKFKFELKNPAESLIGLIICGS